MVTCKIFTNCDSKDTLIQKMVSSSFCTTEQATAFINSFYGSYGASTGFKYRMTKHTTDVEGYVCFSVIVYGSDGLPRTLDANSVEPKTINAFNGSVKSNVNLFAFNELFALSAENAICYPAFSSRFGFIDGMLIPNAILSLGAKYLINNATYLCLGEHLNAASLRRYVLVKWTEPETAV